MPVAWKEEHETEIWLDHYLACLRSDPPGDGFRDIEDDWGPGVVRGAEKKWVYYTHGETISRHPARRRESQGRGADWG